MIETISNWNIYEQILCGSLTVIIICIVVGLLWLHVNVETISDSQIAINNVNEKNEAALKKVKDEYEAYIANDLIDDAEEAQRLSNIDK